MDRVSSVYLQNLQKLPLLDVQGDGIRSFLGTLFHLLLAREFVVMIDEPEAFLHPPQARQLGILIGQMAKDRQVFLATHSSDILRDLMDGDLENLTILHLRREGKINKPMTLQREALAKAWADPTLRYSNILDGLFHDLVVLCESEADCRFYHAASDKLLEGTANSLRRPDVMFSEVGGKTGFSRAVSALAAFGIPVKVIVDFDILNSEDLLQKICLKLGMNWADLSAPARMVRSAVEKVGAPPPTIGDLRGRMDALLAGSPKERLNQHRSTQLVELVRYPSPWSLPKKIGKSFIPSGQESAAVETLLTKLQAGGVFVVPVGELECWVRIAGGHSTDWLSTVFDRMRSGENPFSDDLLHFVASIIGQESSNNAVVSATTLSQAVDGIANGKLSVVPGANGSRPQDHTRTLASYCRRFWMPLGCRDTVFAVGILIAIFLSIVALVSG